MTTKNNNKGVISRQAAVEVVERHYRAHDNDLLELIAYELEQLPTAEPLTDREQRIFLAAMAREEKICEEVDRNFVREPYEDSLMSVCRRIKRKVKEALWT